jgi:hypothetical protein
VCNVLRKSVKPFLRGAPVETRPFIKKVREIGQVHPLAPRLDSGGKGQPCARKSHPEIAPINIGHRDLERLY